MTEQKLHTIGNTAWRKDGIAKVTGTQQYAPDVAVPHQWHGRVLRSPFAHAEIVSVDTSAAEAMGAVCLTFDDVPKVRYNERIVSTPPNLYRDRYVLADKARHVGEPIAAVAAPTEALAEKALRAIEVQYRPLKASLNAEAATSPDADALYDKVILGTGEVAIESNVAVRRHVEVGNVDEGFAECDLVMERTYTTVPQYHAQMEPKSVLCEPARDGSLTIWASAQSIHNVRMLIGEIYGIPLNKINVRRTLVGGTFGSSIQVNSVVPVCVGLALKSGHPVKIASTREEDMHSHLRYPSRLTLKMGVKRDGTVVAGEMNATIEIGAHNIQAFPFLGVLAGFFASLYKMPHMRYDGKAVYTNRTPSCAMQGFGAPQVHFAVESLVDEIATELGIDPLDMKLKNYVGLGGTFWGHGPTVKSIILSDGVPELLERGAEHIGWRERPKPEEQTGRYRRGIGLARGFHTSGVGQPKAQGAEMIDYSGAIVKINEDGSVDLAQSLMDHGGGTLEAIAKIVAEELGVPLDKVGISPVDTKTTVYDVTTHATRGVYAGGAAAHKAAKTAKAKLLALAGRMLEVMPDALVIEPDEELGQGVIFCPGMPDRKVTVGEVARHSHVNSWGTIAAVESVRQVTAPPAYVTQFIEVEVDTHTGLVRTLRAALGADCGTVVNPILAAGQMEGGLSKGAGYALIEDIGWDAETGQLDSKGFWIDGKTPSVSEAPLLGDVTVDFADTYEPTGPFGAKGIGEASMNPVAAAYTNALYGALGVRFYDLPVTPEKILAALREREATTGAPAEAPRETTMVTS